MLRKSTVRLPLFVVAAALAAGMGRTADAEYSIANEGLWPKSWHKELEPLRKQSRTIDGPLLGPVVYEIPFTDRNGFEKAWPHIVKLKSKKAAVILVRGPSRRFKFLSPVGAGVRVVAPAGPQITAAEAKRLGVTPRTETEIELVVDGRIVDLNRIPLPADTRVIDRRFEDCPLVRGDVVDVSTSRPIVNAEIVFEDIGSPPAALQRAQVDDRGRFEVKKIRPGDYRIWITAEGYVPRLIATEKIATEKIATEKITLHDQTFVDLGKTGLAKPATLGGIVVDTAGKPLAKALVRLAHSKVTDGIYLTPTVIETTSDASGRFTLSGVPTGKVQVRSRLKFYYHGPPLELHEAPARDVRIRMVKTGMIKVAVFDSNGKLLGGDHIVGVEAHDDAAQKWSRIRRLMDGQCIFKEVPPGRYRVWTRPVSSRDSILSPSRVIELKSNKAISVEFR